ncbi:MAG TPA: sugar phosphate isomerase/epimerase family protein [bacterium]|mgnify:CR=1 FL=1|nr:MAG: Inosose dehydratase [bacterium ADurb.Bin236]HPI76132.1 sugar phosphate isomerase/epimerase family protein [bacterium]HPN94553.1 sugar phosphate isomerase/epimerase family protein [bacterium]
MKIGCCSWSHHRHFESGDMDIFDWMEHCADTLKVGGIEITDGHLDGFGAEYLAKVKRVATELCLTISGVTISNDYGKSGAKALDAEVERMRVVLEATLRLGAPVLRVFAGWPDADKEKQWAEMARRMKASCKMAERYGIVLAVENHNHGGFIQTAGDVERLFADVDSRCLSLNLDTGNFIDGFPSIEKTIEKAVHIHAKMLNIGPDGTDTTTDYPRFAALMKQVNYRGFVCVEYEGKEDELSAVTRGVEYLRKLMLSQG